jgi:hypothetical protein
MIKDYCYSKRNNKEVIARSEATWQSHGIASLRPEHHAVQGFVRNDTFWMLACLRRSL